MMHIITHFRCFSVSASVAAADVPHDASPVLLMLPPERRRVGGARAHVSSLPESGNFAGECPHDPETLRHDPKLPLSSKPITTGKDDLLIPFICVSMTQ